MKVTKLKLPVISFLFLLTACNKESEKQTAVKSSVAYNVSEANLKNNLVAWYTFDGDVLDHSGNGNNVAFNNATPTEGKNGLPNTAYKFDGNSYMTVPNSSSLQGVPGKGITIAVKIKVEGFYNGSCHANRILQKGFNDQQNGVYYLSFDDAAYWNYNQCDKPVAAEYENFSGVAGDNQFHNSSARSDENIRKNKWYVVIYTFDPKTKLAQLYINNKTVPDTVTYNTNVDYTANAGDLYIGRNQNPIYPYWFKGVIDEIRIYNKNLNNNEARLVSEKLMEK